MEVNEMNTDIPLQICIYSKSIYLIPNILSRTNDIEFGLRNIICSFQNEYHNGSLVSSRERTHYNDIFNDYKKWKLTQ